MAYPERHPCGLGRNNARGLAGYCCGDRRRHCWPAGRAQREHRGRVMIQRVASTWKVLGVVMAVLLWSQMTWAETITLGSISVEPADENKKFLPLANYLVQQLQAEGIH